MVYCWYMSPERLSKMYKGTSNCTWKCEEHKGLLLRRVEKKKKKLDKNIYDDAGNFKN